MRSWREKKRQMRPIRWSVALVTAALILPACGKQVEEAPAVTAITCGPSNADLQSLASIDEIEGEHGLLLTVREGEKVGASTAGTLTLVPRDSTGVPYYGWTDIDLPSVGAYQQGAVDSRSMEAPGVLVLATRSPNEPRRIRSLTIRLGSHANRNDVVAFDGAYTALYVRWIGQDEFGGDWASGVQGPETTGEFCAVRASPSD
jgi:hypothetical protein